MDLEDVRLVADPVDEYNHEPDPAPNYNESMYVNAFDHEGGFGGWFRLGNRVNEGYAEMSCCVHLPDGRVAFMFDRPAIDTNEVFDAGGMRIEVIEPFAHLRVTYEGRLCLLDDPTEMAEPRRAFRTNPLVDAAVELDVRGVSPILGGRPVLPDGSEPTVDAEQGFARAHYEQHCRVTGTIRVGDEVLPLDGLGLRDKSWGPRYWQSIGWYRWLPMNFTTDFAVVVSVIDRPGREPRQGGAVLSGGRYHPIRRARIRSDVDGDGYQRALVAEIATDADEYRIEGEVVSLIPLRNRRRTPDGAELLTRITEGMTRYRCGELTGWGMSEYLDQIVDGSPVGPDIREGVWT